MTGNPPSAVTMVSGPTRPANQGGVGILAASYTSARNAKARVCIVSVPERGRILLEIVGLWGVIEHFENEEDALASAES